MPSRTWFPTIRGAPAAMAAFRPGCSVFAALLFFALTVPAQAQAQESLHGTLRGEQGEPIAGAMVSALVDGSVVARYLTDANGNYEIELPGAGRYELRVDRIGYQSTFSGAIDVPVGASVRRDQQVSVEPVVLRGLDVRGDQRCSVDPREGLATAVVWEEARKALEAARWTAQRELYRFAWVRYRRDLDARSRRVRNEDRERRSGYAPSPFRALSADSLVEHGFVHERQGESMFFAPDAEVLLSDAFLESHCFALRRNVDEGGEPLLGLTFEPVQWRRLPDVRGVLWLDDDGRLRSIEYEYMNHRTLPVVGQDGHGGLTLRGLPNGTWIVEEWSIALPRLAEVRASDGRPRRYDVRGYVEEGGFVTEVTRRGGTLVARPGQPGIRGTVTDSLDRPAVGARAWIDGTVREAITDERGWFTIDDLGRGVWSVRVTHPELRAWGHQGEVVEMAVEEGDSDRIQVQLPSLAALAQSACEMPADSGTAGLLGRAIDRRGEPLARAAVRARWTADGRAGRAEIWGSSAESDAQGVFRLCSLPAGTPVLLSAHTLHASGSTEVEIPPEAGAFTAEVQLRATEEAGGADVDPGAQVFVDLPAWVDSTGFRVRRDDALLQLGPAELRLQRPDDIAEILTRVPRLELRVQGNGLSEFRLHPTEDWREHRGEDRSCALTWYLNGNLLQQRVGDIREMQLHRILEPRDMSAVEVFDGSRAPVGDTDSCGAILLWVAGLRDADDPLFRGTLEGRVVADTGTVSEGIPVRLVPGEREVLTDSSGRFVFAAVPPGRYVLDAEVPGWGNWRMEVDVRAGAVSRVTVSSSDAPGGAEADADGASSSSRRRESLELNQPR